MAKSSVQPKPASVSNSRAELDVDRDAKLAELTSRRDAEDERGREIQRRAFADHAAASAAVERDHSTVVEGRFVAAQTNVLDALAPKLAAWSESPSRSLAAEVSAILRGANAEAQRTTGAGLHELTIAYGFAERVIEKQPGAVELFTRDATWQESAFGRETPISCAVAFHRLALAGADAPAIHDALLRVEAAVSSAAAPGAWHAYGETPEHRERWRILTRGGSRAAIGTALEAIDKENQRAQSEQAHRDSAAFRQKREAERAEERRLAGWRSSANH